MKIELKRIEFSERLSEDSNCFVADLYINGAKIGKASNRGDGESTDYEPDKKEGWPIIAQAVKYCSEQPPLKAVFDGEYLEFNMDLSVYLDDLVNRYMAAKALKAFNNKIRRGTGKNIVYANPDPEFLVLRFNCQFADIVSFKIWKEELVESIRSTVRPVQIGNKVYYVTNIPADICTEAGLSPLKNKLRSIQNTISGKQKLKSKHGRKL